MIKMKLFLLAVFAPVVVSPLIFFLSTKVRKIVMSLYILGLLSLAFLLPLWRRAWKLYLFFHLSFSAGEQADLTLV